MSLRTPLAAALVAALGASLPDAQIGTVRVASGLQFPVYVTHAPGDFGRIFIVEKPGVIRALDLATGAVSTFLDINPLVVRGTSTNDERGLLGLAFHPQYQSNGFFYVHYINNSSDTVVSRFTVLGDPATSGTGDSTSESIVLTVDQPQTNHNGGWIGFSPNDGYLYVALGDGGNFCDTGTGHTAGTGNAQDITSNLLGKILRLDVDSASPYAIPADNPFVGVTGDDEIWLYGLRNPYRCSFDSATGDLYIGDVGQNQAEEIDFLRADGGGGHNYGWRCMEGTVCPSGASGCPATTGCNCPAGTPGLVAPILDYSHNPPLAPAASVCSVIAGYAYRGSCIPEIQGTFFFGDFCAGGNSVWSFDVVGGAPVNFTFRDELSPATDGTVVNQIVSFGEDASGEMYVVDQGTGANGNVFRIVPLATVVNRSQSPNPDSYAASALVMGSPFNATVDNNVAGQSSSLLIAFDAPTTVTLSGGQVLLVLDVSGSGELFTGSGLSPTGSAAGVDTYSAAVPENPALCGLRLYTQAIQFGNPPFALSNAQDVRVGF